MTSQVSNSDVMRISNARDLVKQLREAIDARLPVGTDNHNKWDGSAWMGGFPELPPIEAITFGWLLDRSTVEGSIDEFMWKELRYDLGKIAHALREVGDFLKD